MVEPNERTLDAAKREFREETGFAPVAQQFIPLGQVRQKSGKIVHAWAFEGDCDPSALCSSTFEMEWPPRSGHLQEFPEIDRIGFFDAAAARRKLIPAQRPFIDRAQGLWDPATTISR